MINLDNPSDIINPDPKVGNAILIASLENCEPCTLVKDSISNLFANSPQVRDKFKVSILNISRDEKRKIFKRIKKKN